MRDVPVRSAFLVDRGGHHPRSMAVRPSEVPDLDVLLSAARSLPFVASPASRALGLLALYGVAAVIATADALGGSAPPSSPAVRRAW